MIAIMMVMTITKTEALRACIGIAIVAAILADILIVNKISV
jgi:hypothetical protein